MKVLEIKETEGIGKLEYMATRVGVCSQDPWGGLSNN